MKRWKFHFVAVYSHPVSDWTFRLHLCRRGIHDSIIIRFTRRRCIVSESSTRHHPSRYVEPMRLSYLSPSSSSWRCTNILSSSRHTRLPKNRDPWPSSRRSQISSCTLVFFVSLKIQWYSFGTSVVNNIVVVVRTPARRVVSVIRHVDNFVVSNLPWTIDHPVLDFETRPQRDYFHGGWKTTTRGVCLEQLMLFSYS